MIKPNVADVLEYFQLTPVLADIGSSGSTQVVFAPLASSSQIIGFDADARGQDSKFGRAFKEHTLIPRAVVPDSKQKEVAFILTKHPSCSSTLEPNMEELQEYSFRDFFQTEGSARAQGITLNETLQSIGKTAFDWIKVDSQGTDLRLLKSLNLDAWNQLLAVDIEPGLINAYRDEDLFSTCHEYLTQNGFWLANAKMQAYPRVRPETLKAIESRTDIIKVQQYLKRAPTCVEGRYFRTLKHLDTYGNRRNLILAVIFAAVDSQFGYAYDIVEVFKNKIGDTKATDYLLKFLDFELRQSVSLANSKAKNRNSLKSAIKATFSLAKQKLLKRVLVHP